VWTTDQNGQTTFISSNIEKIYGYTPKEIYEEGERLWFGRIHPDDVERVNKAFEAVFEEKVQLDVEYRIRRKDGEWIWLHDRSIGSYVKNGIKYADGVFSDITERKQMEARVVKSRELFSKVFYVNPVPATITTVSNDKLLMVNDAWLKLIGFDSQEEAIGKSAVDLGLWADIEDREERNTNLQESGSSDIQEMRVHTPSGRFRDCLYTAEMIEYEGQPHILSMAIDITQRKKAQEALRVERDKLQALMDGINRAGIGIDIIGANYEVLFQNKIVEEECGEPRGKCCYEHYMALEQPCEQCPVMEAIKENKTVSAEQENNGRYYQVFSAPLPDTDGTVSKAIEIVLEITERKRAEEAMKKSSIIIDSTSDAVITTDIAGNITFWNKGAEIIYGYQKEEAIGKPVSILYKDEDLHILEAMIADLLEGKDIPGIEATCIDKNHQDIEILLSLTSIRDEDGNITELVGITKDITERKKSEEEIERIFNMTDYMICIASLNGYFKRINSSFEQTLGYSSEELLKKPFFDFIHPDDKEKTKAVVEEELSRGSKVIGFENRYRCKDGSYKWLSWTSHPVVDEGITYAIAYDVTERKKAQQKLLEYQRQLKSLASELLLAEERERRRIATGVHDDIGQKLALAKLELQSIQATVSESDVSASIGHACELIDNGIQDSRSLAFDLSNPVLYEVGFTAAVESLLTERMMQKSGINTEFKSKIRKLNLSQDISIVLFQAVRELLTNVVKHANANKVKVCIDKSDHRAQVIVEDDGVGFELSGLKSPDKEKGGFGLFNVKERLEYLGGSFDIESKPGQGTRVTMAVPLESGVTASRKEMRE
jgi:PAS domain S-box-containing protein